MTSPRALRAALAALPLLSLPLSTGSAEATLLAMHASGSIGGFLPISGCGSVNTIGFTGTAVSTPLPSTGTVYFNGYSTAPCPTLFSDQGGGYFSGAYNGYATYVRTATSMRFRGPTFTFGCLFTPTSLNPTYSFMLDCTSESAT